MVHLHQVVELVELVFQMILQEVELHMLLVRKVKMQVMEVVVMELIIQVMVVAVLKAVLQEVVDQV